MQKLDLPKEIKGILSFDFDGTLLDPTTNPQLDPLFFEVIDELREQGWIWGINTGRSQMQTVAGFNEGVFPVLPDFMVARERELYTPGDYGRWKPITEWNKRSEKDHKKMFKKSKRLLKEIRSYVEESTNARWVSEEGDPAGVVATSHEEMDEIIAHIDERKSKVEMMGYLRNTIYMRFSHKDYHKGSSLAEITRRCDLDSSQVFAIGDGHNDIDMLHKDYAGMIACPANSSQAVKQHVEGQGGYLCKQPASLGVVEALRHFFD